MRHPTQLYEAFLEGVVLFIWLQWLSHHPKYKPGFIIGGFLLGYAVLRSGVEFYRVPDQHIGYLYADWLTMGQVLCFPLALLGLWILWQAHHNRLPGLQFPPFESIPSKSERLS